jgi:iron only hydrogenase large subunit-like protein
LAEQSAERTVWDAIHDSDKIVMVQTAPAVRFTLGECFGLPAGSEVTGKMVAALRRIGFVKVFDTDVAADLTVMEEGTELVKRHGKGCVAHVHHVFAGVDQIRGTLYPEFLPNLSAVSRPANARCSGQAGICRAAWD